MAQGHNIDQVKSGSAWTTYFPVHFDAVCLASDGSADLFYKVDGTVASGSGTKLAAGSASEVNILTPAGNTIVSVFSSGAPAYSVIGGQRSLSKPPHTASNPILF